MSVSQPLPVQDLHDYTTRRGQVSLTDVDASTFFLVLEDKIFAFS